MREQTLAGSYGERAARVFWASRPHGAGTPCARALALEDVQSVWHGRQRAGGTEDIPMELTPFNPQRAWVSRLAKQLSSRIPTLNAVWFGGLGSEPLPPLWHKAALVTDGQVKSLPPPKAHGTWAEPSAAYFSVWKYSCFSLQKYSLPSTSWHQTPQPGSS